MADESRIHLVNGQNIDVPGTVHVVQSQLQGNRGALVAMKDRRGDDVIVNPEHVVSIEKAPGRGAAGFA